MRGKFESLKSEMPLDPTEEQLDESNTKEKIDVNENRHI